MQRDKVNRMSVRALSARLWKALASINLSLVLCLLLAACAVWGYACIHRQTALFIPLNDMGLVPWARTWGRADTFFGAGSGRKVTHISYAEPYCPEMRKVAIDTIKELGLPVHESGTVVTIQGPRFSTKAESEWFNKMGWATVNMTQYPECYLARELEICYCNIAVVTDYDAGCGEHEAVTNEEVIRMFGENIDHLKDIIFHMVPKLPQVRECACKDALGGAEM